MRNRMKSIAAFALLAAVCLAGIFLDLRDRRADVYPKEDTLIRLYGEAHGEKVYYDIEFALWSGCYEDGCRNLFVELPYYSAEFLNIWMQDDTDDLLDKWFEEIDGTLSGNEHYYEFLREIKAACPETVFYGTDVGHQGETTGARYLRYLEEQGLRETEQYRLAQACIRQGEEFRSSRTEENGMSPVREAYMVSNFEDAYARCGGGRIMGIYGSYHTDLNASDLMAGQLRANYGDLISSVKINTIALDASAGNPYKIGFCVTGLIYLIMLFVPNIIWARWYRPAGYAEAEKHESRALLALERAGQAAATVSVLMFPAINPHVKRLPEGVFFRWDVMILTAAFVLMVLYECYWIRYFISRHTMEDMYASFAGFPVAGATLPVAALLLMGVCSRNLIVIASAGILGVGHIGIHLMHRAELSRAKR